MSRLRIEKWEGLGNDFVVFDAREASALPEWVVDAQAEAERQSRFRAWCDRHRGVGADGVLLVKAAANGVAQMFVYNADGSRPEMCGNGLRCVAAFLVSHGAPAEFSVETEAGLKLCRVERGEEAFNVSVSMGPARDEGVRELTLLGATVRLRDINIGNPHAILFEPFPAVNRDELAVLLEHSRQGLTNVEFATVRDESTIDLVVWERGVGYTQACGTGACATVFAAALDGRLAFDHPTTVQLPGGELSIRCTPEGAVQMLGPARRTFVAELG
jgi:diaminopimelate epimerase